MASMKQQPTTSHDDAKDVRGKGGATNVRTRRHKYRTDTYDRPTLPPYPKFTPTPALVVVFPDPADRPIWEAGSLKRPLPINDLSVIALKFSQKKD